MNMTLEELEKRIIYLEDMEKIKMLHREYLFHISNVEMDKALECFSENIVTDIAQYGIKKGKLEVSKFFKEVIRNNVFTSKEGHFTGQPVIKLEGNKATGHWMFYRFIPETSPKRWVQGRYDCEYVKENGEWKFSLVKLTRPWPEFFK
jgi:hypothetical protein